ncbi:MAG: DUF3455 domain-containing protein [Polyangiales bacterium]
MFSCTKPSFTSLVALVCIAAAGCAARVDTEEQVAESASALSAKSVPAVPAALAVPTGNKLAFFWDGEGVQIYTCNATASGGYAWTFKAPEANLFDKHHRVVGAHYAGPTWEALDGSTVVGSKLAAYTADATAIPWLLLQAVSHTGDGRMSEVSYVQRLSTNGGLAPASGCDADHLGAEADVPYTATYYFYEADDAKGHCH